VNEEKLMEIIDQTNSLDEYERKQLVIALMGTLLTPESAKEAGSYAELASKSSLRRYHY
tara:strand:- start:450 stop:626 length:177 start_codon:yes stop_codon:yes gene_type:complete